MELLDTPTLSGGTQFPGGGELSPMLGLRSRACFPTIVVHTIDHGSFASLHECTHATSTANNLLLLKLCLLHQFTVLRSTTLGWYLRSPAWLFIALSNVVKAKLAATPSSCVYCINLLYYARLHSAGTCVLQLGYLSNVVFESNVVNTNRSSWR